MIRNIKGKRLKRLIIHRLQRNYPTAFRARASRRAPGCGTPNQGPPAGASKWRHPLRTRGIQQGGALPPGRRPASGAGKGVRRRPSSRRNHPAPWTWGHGGNVGPVRACCMFWSSWWCSLGHERGQRRVACFGRVVE